MKKMRKVFAWFVLGATATVITIIVLAAIIFVPLLLVIPGMFAFMWLLGWATDEVKN